jgi:hypothetical protein
MLKVPARLLLAAALWAASAVASSADLYVVCNAHAALTAGDVHDLFLGEKQFVGATKLVPIDNSAAQAMFLERVLMMSAAKYSTTWTKKSFRDGINPPLVAGSDIEALAFLRRTPGACGYVTTPQVGDLEVISRL